MGLRLSHILRAIIPERLQRSICYVPGAQYINRSYSQEGEDLLLQRIFEYKTDGFYVDVGAFHPYRLSNTMRLYEEGWRGICIEPNPDTGKLFKTYRPQDTLVNKGVSSTPGDMTYYMFESAPLNTFSKEVVDGLTGHKTIAEVSVETQTLSTILQEHLPEGQDIDLLSIDAEGMDYTVLQTNDWQQFRPQWVICEFQGGNMKALLDSPLHKFMVEKGYIFSSKLLKSVFYEDSRDK